MGRLSAIDLKVAYSVLRRFRIQEDDPLSARAEIVQRTELGRGGWSTRIETRTRCRATLDHFELSAELDAYEGELPVFSKNWQRSIPREGV